MENTTPKTSQQMLDKAWELLADQLKYPDVLHMYGASHEFDTSDIENFAKYFARQVAEQVKQYISEKAKIKEISTPMRINGIYDIQHVVDKESILSINLDQFIR